MLDESAQFLLRIALFRSQQQQLTQGLQAGGTTLTGVTGSNVRLQTALGSLGQSAAPGAKSTNASTTVSGGTCARPKERIPGVSIIQVPGSIGSPFAFTGRNANADEEVWRPRPVTAFT